VRRAPQRAPVHNIILANNATAVDAAGVRAVELGYRYIMQSARTVEGDVAELSTVVANVIEQLAGEAQVDCWISGGEPTVRLPPPEACGRGGRNQQLALLSLLELERRGWPTDRKKFARPLIFLSAGTDGVDGPTPAAGAWFDSSIWAQLQASGLDPQSYADRADAYSLFEQLGCLIQSGPTGTNVCDLRIALKPHDFV
jgi:hydroxypyruvate reductase